MKPLQSIAGVFKDAGFECFLVGGSVRDLILGIDATDHDLATNARPADVTRLFRRTIPTGIKHGTVTVLVDDIAFEVTTYRADGKYMDGRRPENVSFSDTLIEDVKRRDFTINGLAYDLLEDRVIDHVNGIDDIEKKIIRTIGNALDRFSEDGLRPYRACRFAAKLNFEIEENTFNAIRASLETAALVSPERVRDEIMKLLESDRPSIGLDYMLHSGLLNLCLPELAAADRVDQNKYHIHDVYLHSVYSCDAGPRHDPLIRLAALLHDIGKVPTRRVGENGDYTFYNHEVIGSRAVKKIMKRLKFSNEDTERVVNLVVNHMFHYTEDWTDGAVRRFMRKVGMENLDDLFQLRLADRVGNGARSGLPAPISVLKQRIQKAIDEENAITVRDLKINGHDLMDAFKLQPGPVIGRILNDLLETVLDDPAFNERETLMSRAAEILEGIPEDERVRKG